MVKTTGQSGVKAHVSQLIIPAAEDMEVLGAKLAQSCPSACIILLQGHLGAGKTTLVRGFLRALGFSATVKSPTYTLVEPYYLDKYTVYHFDFYRISSPDELESIGLRDYFDRSAICLIEWPEKADQLAALADLHIGISFCKQGRQVVLQALSPAGLALINITTSAEGNITHP